MNISRDHRNNENTYHPARTSANTRYYLQQRRQRQTDGVNDGNEGAKQVQEDGRAAEGFYSAEMRRQRVLGMYGTGYAIHWAVSPKGRAGLMTPDREALGALRRNLPPTPEETMARTKENIKKVEPFEEDNEKLQSENCETAEGTTNGSVLSNLCQSHWRAPFP